MNRSFVALAADSGMIGSIFNRMVEIWIGMAERGAPPPGSEGDGFR
jgi:hypothetical protein